MAFLPAARTLACVLVAMLLLPRATVAQSGNLRWRFKPNLAVESSPVLGADGTVYVGSDDGYLYAIDTAGSQRWRFKTNDWVLSSPVLGADGTVYVGSNDGYLYAIYTGINCSCPAGTYVNATSRFTSCPVLEDTCIPCSKGSYCPYRRSAAVSPLPCPAGCFCNGTNMPAPIPCPAGHYNPAPGADTETSCR